MGKATGGWEQHSVSIWMVLHENSNMRSEDRQPKLRKNKISLISQSSLNFTGMLL